MRRARLALPVLTVVALVAGLAATGSAAGTASTTEAATFTNYAAPAALGNSAGEPTLGLNPETGAVLFQSYTEFLKVTDFDKAGPGKATWTKQTHALPHATSLDPILETDPDTGRTFSSQLFAACSQTEFTDDDGATFTPSEGCGAARRGRPPDHRHRPVRQGHAAGEEPGDGLPERRLLLRAGRPVGQLLGQHRRRPDLPDHRRRVQHRRLRPRRPVRPPQERARRHRLPPAEPVQRRRRGRRQREQRRHLAGPQGAGLGDRRRRPQRGRPSARTATSTSAGAPRTAGDRRSGAGRDEPGQGPEPGPPRSRSARTSRRRS